MLAEGNLELVMLVHKGHISSLRVIPQLPLSVGCSLSLCVCEAAIDVNMGIVQDQYLFYLSTLL